MKFVKCLGFKLFIACSCKNVKRLLFLLLLLLVYSHYEEVITKIGTLPVLNLPEVTSKFHTVVLYMFVN